MDVLFIILAMVLLLLLQGFFSGSEIALVHADRLKLHHLANQGHRGAALVLKLFRKPEVLLGTTLVGTNLSVVVLTTLGTILMIRFFEFPGSAPTESLSEPRKECERKIESGPNR